MYVLLHVLLVFKHFSSKQKVAYCVFKLQNLQKGSDEKWMLNKAAYWDNAKIGNRRLRTHIAQTDALHRLYENRVLKINLSKWDKHNFHFDLQG